MKCAKNITLKRCRFEQGERARHLLWCALSVKEVVIPALNWGYCAYLRRSSSAVISSAVEITLVPAE